MKIILILLGIVHICEAKIICPSSKHPIYCRILELKPQIKKPFAFKFSNLLHKYTKKYNLDPMRALAIAMQESSLNKVHRKQVIIEENSLDIYQGFSDLTMFQFHVYTIQAHNFEVERLLAHDLEYSIECYCKLMKFKKKVCKHLGKDAWTCYHSTSKSLRTIYKTLVDRYYPVKSCQEVFSGNH